MSHKKFQNKDCEYFPCHQKENLNCLFCFCPLYSHENCGGKYKILDNGIKDCSACELPHSDNGYDYIIDFLKNNTKRYV